MIPSILYGRCKKTDSPIHERMSRQQQHSVYIHVSHFICHINIIELMNLIIVLSIRERMKQRNNSYS